MTAEISPNFSAILHTVRSDFVMLDAFCRSDKNCALPIIDIVFTRRLVTFFDQPFHLLAFCFRLAFD